LAGVENDSQHLALGATPMRTSAGRAEKFAFPIVLIDAD
jgi:hypothetical protein